MQANDARIESLRPDAFRLIVGVLWLIATGILVLTSDDIVGAVRFVDARAADLTHLEIPSFAYGFLLFLFGIVLPYCLGEVFNPVGVLVMNMTLRVYRGATKSDTSLLEHAGESLARELGTRSAPPNTTWSSYLVIHAPRIANNLASKDRTIQYRAAALLPGSVILGWFVRQGLTRVVSAPFDSILAVTFAIAVFAIAASNTCKRLHLLNSEEALAICAVARRRMANGGDNAEQKP